MLTEKQKKKIYDAGSCDEYINEIICEHAENFINEEFPNILDEDLQDAVSIYSDGFIGAPLKSGIQETKLGCPYCGGDDVDLDTEVEWRYNGTLEQLDMIHWDATCRNCRKNIILIYNLTRVIEDV